MLILCQDERIKHKYQPVSVWAAVAPASSVPQPRRHRPPGPPWASPARSWRHTGPRTDGHPSWGNKSGIRTVESCYWRPSVCIGGGPTASAPQPRKHQPPGPSWVSPARSWRYTGLRTDGNPSSGNKGTLSQILSDSSKIRLQWYLA